MTLKQLFSDLESRKEKKIQAALELLENDSSLKEQAENRYLKLIQARLNDTNATLADIDQAAPTNEEIELVQKVLSGGHCYNFEYLEDQQSKAVVDLIGGIVASSLNMEEYLENANQITVYNDLWKFGAAQYQFLKNALKEAIDLSSNSGWFAKIAKKVRAAKMCYQWRFDHTAFEDANKSLVLREFIYCLFEKKHKDDLDNGVIEIDVFQSTAPNLTEAIWLMLYRSKFIIKNTTTIQIPDSTLSLGLNKDLHFKIEADLVEFLHGPYYAPYNEEFAKILIGLESRNDKKIQKALNELEENNTYKRIAERRYLSLIRLRLNNPSATLADIAAASPSQKEVKLITSNKYLDIKNYRVNIKHDNAEACKTFVNLIGGVIAGCLDIDQYINLAKTTKDEKELNALLWRKNNDGYGDALSVHLNRHYRLSQTSEYSVPNGWFNKILCKLKSTNDRTLFHNLDLISFHLKEDAATAFNESEMLPEFMYYIYRATFNNGYQIDIQQDVFPNLTHLFWIFGTIPTISIKNQSINVLEELPPNNLLTYSRAVPSLKSNNK